mgnify:CR=1 FL=1
MPQALLTLPARATAEITVYDNREVAHAWVFGGNGFLSYKVNARYVAFGNAYPDPATIASESETPLLRLVACLNELAQSNSRFQIVANAEDAQITLLADVSLVAITVTDNELDEHIWLFEDCGLSGYEVNGNLFTPAESYPDAVTIASASETDVPFLRRLVNCLNLLDVTAQRFMLPAALRF